ncbi:ADP-ribosylglycohydrolase family protein [uncultured Devosia sp.]|uniref:ADP-ribosylglycohydrolase family protein n=1 Tax=uncultured Devosia sp. TaxID=211434 RepID=UPI0035C99559
MHNVLDLRDIVPDEAEQLAHSGYHVGNLLDAARRAAAIADYPALSAIADQLKGLQRSAPWPFDEPDEMADIVATIPALQRFPVADGSIRARIHGAWLGRCVGNTMGKPIESLTRTEVSIYLRAVDQWPQRGYVPLLPELPDGVSHLHESAPEASAGLFTDVPRDDDLDWTILALALAERYGRDLTTDDIAREWLDRLPFTQTFTAERAAYRNLIHGFAAPETARVDNPYREWIGALIRADMYGYLNPGDPVTAARAALADARLSHLGNGIYGEMWAAALVAIALSVDTVRPALEAALSVLPPRSRLAQSQMQLLALHASGASSERALDWVDSELGHYNWVHTINNAALIALGLLWGTGFVTSVALTISGGRDTDSNAATVGSVFGALHGIASIPADLVGTTHHRVRSAVRGFDRIEITELADRTLALLGTGHVG